VNVSWNIRAVPSEKVPRLSRCAANAAPPKSCDLIRIVFPPVSDNFSGLNALEEIMFCDFGDLLAYAGERIFRTATE
jgi:hypothetical protein